jgi:hypothetical protein
LSKVTIGFVMSACPSAWNNSAPTGRILMKSVFGCFFFENLPEKIQDSFKSDNNNRYFTWRPIHIFNNISLNSSWITKFSDKSLQKFKTHILGFIIFLNENRAVYRNSFIHLLIHSFIHSAVCLTTGPKPRPKPALHIVRSRASSFQWQYPLLSLRSSSSFLRLLPRLPVTSIPPLLPFLQ